MRLRPPHFANTLLFRISATFLLLLGISLGGYYFWIERTVFNPYRDKEEEAWYENLAAVELDTLASRLAGLSADTAPADAALRDYRDRVERFRAEVLVFDANGRYLASTAPGSLSLAVPRVSTDLLHDMQLDDWDFGSYPVPDEIDAYENRIFEVDAIRTADGKDLAGYLVASFLPLDIASDDLNNDSRLIEAQENIFKALIGLLIYSALTALLIMAWTSRRVRRLSAGVEAFAAGDFGTRVPTRSTDEIGTLGRNFNTMAERIENMVEKLRQKEQFQRQLVANVSHDLRTPMASMRGYVETLLMDDKNLDAQQRQRYLNIITGNLDHLNRLVEHTLVLSRFDSGQATFQFEDFPIVELADSILLRFEGLAASQDVKLELEVGDGVGLVRADPLQIAQVLQNLVENGIKFNRSGGRLVLSLKRMDERIGLEVRDTGRGIPPADLPHIFDRFFTADKSRMRQMTAPDAAGNSQHLGQSSGLGLAIAAKIVAGHNSMLQVESTVDEGTVFRFYLPHTAGEAQEMASGG
jgi:signal transduction histidine kinase